VQVQESSVSLDMDIERELERYREQSNKKQPE